MKKIAALMLALGLGFTLNATSASATTQSDVPICGHNGTTDPAAPCTADELWTMVQQEASYLNDAFNQINALQVKVQHKNAVIAHLRWRLHHHH